MANSYPPCAAYSALMACRLVALDKRHGVRPVGIGETLRQALAKLVMRATGDQAKISCSNFQLYSGLEAGIEGATHAVVQRRQERVREQLCKEKEADDAPEEGRKRNEVGERQE